MSRLRKLYWQRIRRYDGEMCSRCARPVLLHLGRTYWTASDIVWRRVMGQTNVIVCPLCFTKQAIRSNYPVYWEASSW